MGSGRGEFPKGWGKRWRTGGGIPPVQGGGPESGRWRDGDIGLGCEALLMGEKVVLRPPEMENVDPLLCWINDREVGRHLMPHFPHSRAQERDWIERFSRSESDRVLIIQTDEDRSASWACTAATRCTGRPSRASLSRVAAPRRHPRAIRRAR